MKQRIFIGLGVCMVLTALLSACTRYEQRVVPFKMPAAYANAAEVAGATVAAKSYDGKEESDQAFGFNIRDAILPVQVIFDNKGGNLLEIVPVQTFLVDEENNLWPILDQNLAYDRIAKKTELGKVMPEGGKYGALAGVAGGIIGAAIGIVSGGSVGEAALKGAAVGAAAGIAMGGAKGLENQDVQSQIRDDLRTRSLERRAVKPQEIAYGFIFFPGEAKKAKELRLQLKVVGTGVVYPVTFRF